MLNYKHSLSVPVSLQRVELCGKMFRFHLDLKIKMIGCDLLKAKLLFKKTKDCEPFNMSSSGFLFQQEICHYKTENSTQNQAILGESLMS